MATVKCTNSQSGTCGMKEWHVTARGRCNVLAQLPDSWTRPQRSGWH